LYSPFKYSQSCHAVIVSNRFKNILFELDVISNRFQINKDDHSWTVAQEQKRLLQVTKHDAEILGNSNRLEIASKIIIGDDLTTF
jgi:hypothetical protein